MAAVSAEASDMRGPGPQNSGVPEAGQLVRVRGQQWVVSSVNNSHQPQDEFAATRIPGRTLVTLTSVSDDDLGDELTVAWEIEHWPAQLRPPGAVLHAKIIVVDDQVALVGSVNLTGRAMESNLECGILIRGDPQPRAIRAHITGLHAAGLLLRL